MPGPPSSSIWGGLGHRLTWLPTASLHPAPLHRPLSLGPGPPTHHTADSSLTRPTASAPGALSGS